MDYMTSPTLTHPHLSFSFQKTEATEDLACQMSVTTTGLPSGTQQVNTSDDLRASVPRAA